jgi:hypothetical protein
MSLCRLSREGIDCAVDALLKIRYGLAIFPWVDCVLQQVQRAFKDFYNVQGNFVWHCLSPSGEFLKLHLFTIDAGGPVGGLLVRRSKAEGFYPADTCEFTCFLRAAVAAR